MQFQAGIWCPWAEVLCWTCHETLPKSALVRSVGSLRHVDVAVPDAEHELCKCDRCGAQIAVRDSVARCANLRDALVALLEPEPFAPEISLEQTGGMCAAVSISLARAGREHLLYATAHDGPLLLCSYPRSAVHFTEWDWEASSFVAESDVVADVAAAALAQLRIWAAV